MESSSLLILLEKIGNLEARQHSLEVEFIDYIERNPKGSDQWIEARLRALEDRQKPQMYNAEKPVWMK